MSKPALRRRPGGHTLRRQLMLRVSAIVALVALTLSTITTLFAQQALIGALDNQLDAAFSRQQEAPGGRVDRPAGIDLPGQPLGTVVVDTHQGVRGGILTQYGPDRITVTVAHEMLEVTPGTYASKDLPGLGRYRLTARQTGEDITVVGVPLGATEHTLRDIVVLEVILSIGAIIVALIVVNRVVVSSLRSLNRVAQTAQQVSELDLATGEVEVPMRVAPQDADPRNEVGQVGNALNLLLNDVESALAARQASETRVRQFVADASHELRNPLAAIRGYAELTRRDRDKLPEGTAYALGRVESETERMSRLVEDMLLLARLDSRPELELTEVDLTLLVLDVVSDARAAGPAYRWKLDLPEEPITVVADQNKLTQVLANLYANARKHTPEGTTVTTAIREVPGWVEIDVHDDGPGIDPTIADSVFERFTRADTARTRSGAAKDSTGLGLAIVAAVVQAHGGDVAVESQPGDTTFRLRLPADRAQLAPADEGQHAVTGEAGS
ncbi:sensor histidine kinase [Granulicoccus phenolivorans]|uniref:sensor histidine kinase n=1 Tax=Granulicoccus phenolivorans TaxID=266854 RepID=UPI0004172F08|nr:HAMP domain-containing sensor histidine kinase [Granulicoccus phenolivorans]